MTQTATPTDVISPAEAKFWQEQAERAPLLLKREISISHEAQSHRAAAVSVVGLGLGVIFGAAAFSKSMTKNRRWASGVGSAASFGAGYVASLMKDRFRSNKDEALAHIEHFAADPQGIKALATHLSTSVSAEDIQENGLEKAISRHTMEFLMNPLQIPTAAHAMSLIESRANTTKILSR